MLLQRFAGLVVLSILVVPSAYAQTPQPLLARSLSKLEVMQTTVQDKEQIDWSLKVDRAKARQKTGLYLLLAGVGGVVPAFMIMAGDSHEALGLGVMTLFGTGGVATVGLVKWRGASTDLRFLNQEGRAKGYLTSLPTAGAQITLNFDW